MPIRIPPDAKIVQDVRITSIRAIRTLNDRCVTNPGGLVDQVKAAMIGKEAEFAESELARARLVPGTRKGTIDPKKAYDLFRSRKLDLEKFLQCVTVRKEAVRAYLSDTEVELVSTYDSDPAPSLMTEFKPAIETALDLDALANSLSQQLLKQLAAA